MFFAGISERYCIPFRLTLPNVETGPRLGGRAPLNVTPDNPAAAYLLTLPLRDGTSREASIFLAFDISFVLKNRNQVFEDPSLLEVIVHEASRRRSDNAFASKLSPNAIRLLDEIEDTVEGEPYTDHKIGGRPFVGGSPRIEAGIADLTGRGYRHWLQLDVPGVDEVGESADEGDWPFASGIFNLMVCVEGGAWSIAYFWQL